MIVATTGHTEKEYINKCWNHQIDEVLSKPISVEAIRHILDDIIDIN
jgi:CheY-like chemotaxis protein